MFDDVQEARAPLTNPAYERAILALCLIDNTNLDRLGVLRAEDLTDRIMQLALARAQALRDEGQPVNLVTLRAGIEGVRDVDGRGALDVLRSLSIGDQTPPIEILAQQVLQLAQRRRAVRYLRGLQSDIGDERVPLSAIAGDMLSFADVAFADAAASLSTVTSLAEATDAYMAYLASDASPIEIPTGLAGLDAMTGGWHRGQFALIAGRPSMGKSAVALSLLRRTAAAGYGVLFVSLEMTREQCLARLLADLAYTQNSPIAYSNLRPGVLTNERLRIRLERAREALIKLPLEIEPTSGLSMVDIAIATRKARQRMAERGVDLAVVAIDHLLKVKPTKRYAGNSVKELDEVSESCCGLAKAQNVAVIGLHQLNRNVEARENARPTMSDLRGSGALEQDADVVLFPYRPAYALERQVQGGLSQDATVQQVLDEVRNVLELQIGKQRNGPTEMVRAFVDIRANAVRGEDFVRARNRQRPDDRRGPTVGAEAGAAEAEV